MKNILSIDLEEWFQVEAYADLIPRSRWDGFERRAPASTGVLLELLERKGIQATFFVLGWIAEREPGLVKEIAKRGHEIASHGWSHTALWNLDPDRFREEARRSRELLESLSNQKVRGFRAPTFSITRKTLWGLKILTECGYSYDSSIFPVRHDRYGIPDAPLWFHKREEGILEMPMSVLKVGGFRLPVAGGGYFRIFPYQVTSQAIRRINAKGHPAVVYLHPWEFDPEQPTWPGMPSLRRVRHFFGIKGNLVKLEKLLDQFDFGPANSHLSPTVSQAIG